MLPSNLVPTGYSWCVAGGWAACPPLATDMDVWIFDIPDEFELESVAKDLQEYYKGQAEVDGEEFEAEDDANVREGSTEYGSWSRKVGQYTTVSGRKIHFIVTTADTPSDIISSFDISTHQVAITSFGLVIKGDNYTPPGQQPAVLRWTETTYDRYRKICKRFGHRMVLRDAYIKGAA